MDHNIIIQLEFIRGKMIHSGIKNGLQSPKTIRLSKQLDEILNRYDKLNRKTYTTKNKRI